MSLSTFLMAPKATKPDFYFLRLLRKVKKVDRPFFRDFFPFIRKEKFRKLLPLGAKRAPKVTDAFGVYRFCTRHQRVNSNENQICSKWLVIKWETLIRIILLKELFPPEKGKIPLKQAPRATVAFCFCTRHQRVNINENKICSKWS